GGIAGAGTAGLARPVIPRRDRRCQPRPVEPCRLLRLFDHRLAGGGLWRPDDRRAVGARRNRGDRYVRDVRPSSARAHSQRAAADRRRGRAAALERDGYRAATGGAAGAAGSARPFLRCDPPWRARLCRPCSAAWSPGNGARLSGRGARPDHGRRDGSIRRALPSLRRRRLRRDGRHGMLRRDVRLFRLATDNRSAAVTEMSVCRCRPIAAGENYWQVGYIDASSRPCKYIIRAVSPPLRAIQRATFWG